LFIFRRGADTVYLLLYVDDIILTASSTMLLRRTISALQREFAMKDLGPLHHFLGITIEHHPDGMFLHQHTYTLDIIKRATIADCKSCDSGRPQCEACCRLRASCSGRFPVSEHCRGSLVPNLHTARRRLCRATDLFAYARSSGAPSDGHEVHPTLSSGDARLRSSASFEQL
jgi:hypothetical protein